MNTTKPKCDKKQMLAHLQLITKVTGDPMVTVQTFRSDNKNDGEVLYIKADNRGVDELTKLCESGFNIAASPQKMSGKGRFKEDVLGIRFLVLDLDRQITSAEIKRTITDKVKPAFVVQTSKKRYHVYFSVKCKLEVYSDRARALAKVLDGDPQAVDAGRAFRLAGTINWKADRDHFVARLKEARTPPTRQAARSIVEALGGTVKATQTKLQPEHARAESPKVISSQEVEQWLTVIPAEERALWLSVGMGIHDWDQSERGFSVWDAWSRKASEQYNEADQRSTWEGFRQGQGTTIGTVRWHATRFGGSSGVDKQSGESWIPTSAPDIIEYAMTVLAGRVKLDGKDIYVFVNGGWHNDRREATRALQGVVKGLLETAKLTKSEAVVRALKGQASFAQAGKMLEEFSTYRELDATGEDFDAKPELLGVPNGVVDLRTGLFREAQPDDMVSRSTAARFDSEATCPAFRRFLKQIAPSPVYRRYLQTVMGYLLVGHSNEQKAFFMLGTGSNGKGTLTRAIQAAMGYDYCATLSPAFMKGASKGNGNGPTPAIMTLCGVRVAFCTETERKNGIDEPFFKQLTGNDTLTGRHNYGEQQTFKPQCKLLISTNGMPDWQYEDQALWRRVIVLPFTRQFKGEACNSNLDAQLAAETSGILNWMIEGATRYLKNGLGKCPEVEEATREAHRSADTVRRWIETDCEIGKGLDIPASVAFESYQAFAEKRRLVELPQKKFKPRMTALGYRHDRNNRSAFYKGLKLRIS